MTSCWFQIAENPGVLSLCLSWYKSFGKVRQSGRGWCCISHCCSFAQLLLVWCWSWEGESSFGCRGIAASPDKLCTSLLEVKGIDSLRQKCKTEQLLALVGTSKSRYSTHKQAVQWENNIFLFVCNVIRQIRLLYNTRAHPSWSWKLT